MNGLLAIFMDAMSLPARFRHLDPARIGWQRTAVSFDDGREVHKLDLDGHEVYLMHLGTDRIEILWRYDGPDRVPPAVDEAIQDAEILWAARAKVAEELSQLTLRSPLDADPSLDKAREALREIYARLLERYDPEEIEEAYDQVSFGKWLDEHAKRWAVEVGR